jgi:sulfur-oxidizing protein SoxZ
MARTLINVPSNAKKGDVIEIRALLQHPMETGYRPGLDGKILPRDIVKRFVCTFSESGNSPAPEPVFSAELYPAIAANPYFAFHFLATSSGTLTFTWEGDNGFAQTETAALKVS